MASKYQSWTPSGLMAVKATTSAPSRRGVDVSNGVFVSGMYTKGDPVTWEVHVPSLARVVTTGKGRPELAAEGRGSRRAAYE